MNILLIIMNVYSHELLIIHEYPQFIKEFMNLYS
jgi:hypothetical protein